MFGVCELWLGLCVWDCLLPVTLKPMTAIQTLFFIIITQHFQIHAFIGYLESRVHITDVNYVAYGKNMYNVIMQYKNDRFC